MDNVDCNPDTDDTLQACSYKDEHHENCGQNEGAGVKCHNYDQSSSGKTSLVKGEDWKCSMFRHSACWRFVRINISELC